MGEDFGSFIITDRYVGYHWLDVLQQQLCWAHAIRQFTELSERQGAPGKLGRKLLAAAREVFAAHRAYLQDDRDLAWLKAELDPCRDRIEQLLKQGARGRHPKTARFCDGLLDEYVALWTFCEVPGIDPTNNAAERALRHAVTWVQHCASSWSLLSNSPVWTGLTWILRPFRLPCWTYTAGISPRWTLCNTV